MFKTICPRCGTDDCLEVVSGTFTAYSLPLTVDGFSMQDAKQVYTESEIVQCRQCLKEFSLSEVTE